MDFLLVCSEFSLYLIFFTVTLFLLLFFTGFLPAKIKWPQNLSIGESKEILDYPSLYTMRLFLQGQWFIPMGDMHTVHALRFVWDSFTDVYVQYLIGMWKYVQELLKLLLPYSLLRCIYNLLKLNPKFWNIKKRELLRKIYPTVKKR